MIENPAYQISEAEGAYTRITRNDVGEITQLDTYVPEIAEEEHFVGIDFPALQQAYPDVRLGQVNQWADQNDGSICAVQAYSITVSSLRALDTNIIRDTDGTFVGVTFHPEYITAPADVFAVDQPGIVINQRMGNVHSGGNASAVMIDRKPEY
ncbi:MAG TPA: hypothetical protein VHT70_04655 [Candidatus Saccharimonadales bacterium]|jgi:hypothetical protein|nr:hypothetical protein [Candidatus Saccharimonadales bacterium]